MREMGRLKIGIQEQAKKSIFLYENGSVVCGNFSYSGRYKRQFRDIYNNIARLVDFDNIGEYDVSKFRYWTAVDIYNDVILPKWQKSLSSKKIYNMAIESQIVEMIEVIKEEFKHAVTKKWKRIFVKSDIDDPSCPKKAWQIL